MNKIDIVNVLVKHPTGNKILAVKRATSDNVYGGMWALPGGAIEQGETEREAAKRELTEETGLTLGNFTNEPIIVSPLEVRGKTYYVGVFLATVEDGTTSPQDSDISKAEFIEPKALIASLRENKYPGDQIELAENAFKKLFIKFS